MTNLALAVLALLTVFLVSSRAREQWPGQWASVDPAG